MNGHAMTLISPLHSALSASAVHHNSEHGAGGRWSVHAPAPSRPDIVRDLIDRVVAADRRWEFASSNTAAGPAYSPYELLDAANTEALRRIAGQHGWPGFSLVGQDGSEAALRLALRVYEPHDDHEFVRALLRLLTTAAGCGEATWAQWAHLQDRVSVLNGYDQQYGTQYRHDASPLEPELYPVADPQTLAARRITVGLTPAPCPQALPGPRT